MWKEVHQNSLPAAVVEVAVRIVTLPNLALTIFQVVHVFVGFVQIVVDRLTLTEDSKFMSV